MLPPLDTRLPAAVEKEVRSICAVLFPDGEHAFVARAFEWATQCFTGQLADYQPVDTPYHDFEHTLQATLCLVRLLHGRHATAAVPVLTREAFERSLLAILFHDTGYLKRRDDSEGTGAKYTAVHVGRSTAFARAFLAPRGFAEADLVAMENMISCTAIDADLAAIPFQSDLERTLGFALGTADLLGQMAAGDYVEKLPVLFDELAEAARVVPAGTPQALAFASAEDLMRSTPAFWERYVRPKIDGGFQGLYAFLNDPYPDGPNAYVQQIEEHMTRLRSLGAASAHSAAG